MPRQEFSSLRQGLIRAFCPSLGGSGLTLIDQSGRNNHGTLTNMGGQNNWRASGSGVALNFDGANDSVTFASDPASRMVSLWVNFPSTIDTSQFPTLFSAAAEFGGQNKRWLSLCFGTFVSAGATGAKMCLQNDDGSGNNSRGCFTTRNFNSFLNTWLHIAAGWDGTRFFIYVNGVDETNAVGTQGLTVIQNFSGYIGTLTTFRYIRALVDDVRIYSRALTLAEIRLLASRRGIGLTPLPDRAAGLPRKLSVNVGGTWRAADNCLNVGGVWRLGQASVNVAGTWR